MHRTPLRTRCVEPAHALRFVALLTAVRACADSDANCMCCTGPRPIALRSSRARRLADFTYYDRCALAQPTIRRTALHLCLHSSCACASAVLLPAHACPRRAAACPGVPACAPKFDAPVSARLPTLPTPLQFARCPTCLLRLTARPSPRASPHCSALPHSAARKPSSRPCLPMPHDRSALRTGV